MSDSIQGLALNGSESQASQIMTEMARQQQTSKTLLRVKAEQSQRVAAMHTRRQLETLVMNADRALANEASSRVLKSMFGKFSLIQKIMQNMG